MQKPDFKTQLAKAIKDGIEKYQTAIKKNSDKEKVGLAKLAKNSVAGSVNPLNTGAGADYSAGSATIDVPNLNRSEGPANRKKYIDKMYKEGGKKFNPKTAEIRHTGDKTMSTLISPEPKVLHPSDVKKGVLPEGTGPGVAAGVTDMSTNADAGFGASEKDMNKGVMDDAYGADEGMDRGCAGCGNPQVSVLGVLGNTIHALCPACGMMNAYTSPREENAEAKENSDPTVSKAENDYVVVQKKPGVCEYVKRPGEGWITASNGRATGYTAYQNIKDVDRAIKNNKRAEHEAKKVEKTELAKDEKSRQIRGVSADAIKEGIRTKNFNGSTGFPRPSKPMGKGELAKVTPPGEEKIVHKLKDEYGHDEAGKRKAYATAWAIHNKQVKKAEEDPAGKESPQVGTVAAENVKGAKLPEGAPKSKETDGSGDVTKGKIEKGAMVEHIKAQAQKAGVPAKEVLGYKVPKTTPSVKPAATPNFGKKELAKGVQDEMAIKTGKPVIRSPLPPKATGGFQRQMEVQKKPMIPGVNKESVEKAENEAIRNNPSALSSYDQKMLALLTANYNAHNAARAAKNNKRAEHEASKVEKAENEAIRNNPSALSSYDQKMLALLTANYNAHNAARAAKNNKRAEHEASKVEKAEPTMAKPVTKSPASSAPKTTAPKPPVMASKTAAPKL